MIIGAVMIACAALAGIDNRWLARAGKEGGKGHCSCATGMRPELSSGLQRT
jgi:hypothetical protein